MLTTAIQFVSADPSLFMHSFGETEGRQPWQTFVAAMNWINWVIGLYLVAALKPRKSGYQMRLSLAMTGHCLKVLWEQATRVVASPISSKLHYLYVSKGAKLVIHFQDLALEPTLSLRAEHWQMWKSYIGQWQHNRAFLYPGSQWQPLKDHAWPQVL